MTSPAAPVPGDAPTRGRALAALALTTLAFTACFAVWTMNGVLVTFLVDERTFAFDRSQMGWIIGVPILTGAVLRLPAGLLADRLGGRAVLTGVMLLAAGACYLAGFAGSFAGFVVAGLGFGVAGASFAVGVAYTSLWFPKHHQGTVLGIFGMGNVGAAATALVAPALLERLTQGGAHPEGWRELPRLFSAGLAAVAVLFFFGTRTRLPARGAARPTLRAQLAPLAHVRVWRFGLYYFVLFGGFVAISQWLLPYHVNLYAMGVGEAGLMATLFTLPAALTRALGGWLSDRFGARRVMIWVLSASAFGFLLLSVPRMDMMVPGQGVMAAAGGTVTEVSPGQMVIGGGGCDPVAQPAPALRPLDLLVWPTREFWQVPVVDVGEAVVKRQLVAKGVTHVFFQANEQIFTGILLVVGVLMGFGAAAVYRYIPQYFPAEVGVVGGTVGMIGGLGGFALPVLFGYLLSATGLWITCWTFLLVLTLVCLIWLRLVIRRMMVRAQPELAQRIDEAFAVPVAPDAVLATDRRLVCPVHEASAAVTLARLGEEARVVRCILVAPSGLRCVGCPVAHEHAREPGTD